MNARQLLLLLCLCMCRRDCAAETVSVLSCCAVWNQFVAHINSATDQSAATCDPAFACQSSRLKALNNSLNAFHANIIHVSTSDVTITYSNEMLADLLVLSMLGRLVTKEDQANTEKSYPHYVFDEVQNSLRPKYSSCKFEKSMYMTLLCVSIIILITLLVLQLDKNTKIEQEQGGEPDKTKGAFHVSLPTTLTAQTVRYRPLVNNL